MTTFKYVVCNIIIYNICDIMKNNNLENESDDICEVFDVHDDAVDSCEGTNAFGRRNTLICQNSLKIFGNPTRLKIISLLSAEDLCVCDISEALGLNQTTVSNQLRVLRANNIVKYQKRRKNGKIFIN